MYLVQMNYSYLYSGIDQPVWSTLRETESEEEALDAMQMFRLSTTYQVRMIMREAKVNWIKEGF